MTENLDALKAATDAARLAEIKALERRLFKLRAAGDELGGVNPNSTHQDGAKRRSRAPSDGKAISVKTPVHARQRGRVTPAQLASRQLQGRYIALVRQFDGEKKAEFQVLAKEKGRKTAIVAMRKELK